jgi:hypothetical protein
VLKVYKVADEPLALSLFWRAVSENPYFEQGSKRQAQQLQEIQEKLEPFFVTIVEERPEGPTEIRNVKVPPPTPYLALPVDVAQVLERAWDAYASHLVAVRSLLRTKVDVVIDQAQTMTEEAYAKLLAEQPPATA